MTTLTQYSYPDDEWNNGAFVLGDFAYAVGSTLDIRFSTINPAAFSSLPHDSFADAAVVGTNLYILNSGSSGVIRKFNSLTGAMTTISVTTDTWTSPIAVGTTKFCAFGTNHNVLVVDTSTDTPSYIDYTLARQFRAPVLAPNGYVYATATAADRILRFHPTTLAFDLFTVTNAGSKTFMNNNTGTMLCLEPGSSNMLVFETSSSTSSTHTVAYNDFYDMAYDHNIDILWTTQASSGALSSIFYSSGLGVIENEFSGVITSGSWGAITCNNGYVYALDNSTSATEVSFLSMTSSWAWDIATLGSTGFYGHEYRGFVTNTDNVGFERVIFFGGDTLLMADMAPVEDPPISSFVVDVTAGVVPFAPYFESTAEADPDIYINTRAWDFGDGGTEPNNGAVSHTYTVAAEYMANHIVTDAFGKKAVSARRINADAQDRIQGAIWTIPTPPVGATNLLKVKITNVVVSKVGFWNTSTLISLGLMDGSSTGTVLISGPGSSGWSQLSSAAVANVITDNNTSPVDIELYLDDYTGDELLGFVSLGSEGSSAPDSMTFDSITWYWT